VADAAGAMRRTLTALTARLAADSIPGAVILKECAITGQLSLRGNLESAALAQAAIGCGLPSEPNRVAISGDLAALWLGPDEWLLTMPIERLPALAATLAAAFAGRRAAITDVSAARTILLLEGPKAREVLMKGCSLDLHPDHFKPGHCAQTNLARTHIILRQLDPAPSYHLYVRPSYAEYLASWLVDAMAEYRIR